MIRITVYAGCEKNEMRPPTTVEHELVSELDVHEELRRIGLEYKNADYFPTRQVVIVLDPVVADEQSMATIQSKVRDAAVALERTGLL